MLLLQTEDIESRKSPEVNDLNSGIVIFDKRNSYFMKQQTFIPLNYTRPSSEALASASYDFRNKMEGRRSVRFFSDSPVSSEVIENIIMTASSAPSGAHKQPWTFCAVSDGVIKNKIREAAEKEEYENYHGRMSDEWLKDLEKFGTDWHKPFLTIAPWLIIIFKKPYDINPPINQQNETESGVFQSRAKNYYVNESVGIAAGFLISAIHMAGLVTLTHTPSPMNFLHEILGRPENEKPYLILPVGYPEDGALVPDLVRKTSNEIICWY